MVFYDVLLVLCSDLLSQSPASIKDGFWEQACFANKNGGIVGYNGRQWGINFGELYNLDHHSRWRIATTKSDLCR